jgi:hypothetical protein
MKWLLLWPAAGLVFWTIFVAKDFPRYPVGVLRYFAACIITGPCCWVLLLLQKL